jgi:transketolase
MPGLSVFRPGDANEVVEAYRCILKVCHRPAALALSRQPLPTLDRSRYRAASGVSSGAYVFADSDGPPELILIATGSELSVAVEAYETLRGEGIRCRVVSLPCWDLFDQQSPAYRESVLPSAVTARLAIEQGSTLGWERYIGPKGRMIGMHTFGASAPLKALQTAFGFDPTSVLKVAREMLASR